MVGQSHITQTIYNSLKNNRLPHALLFTGLRGTGKTSSARILAKALRCLNPQEMSPCGVCQSCQEITAGRSVDVLEIDGASNNGVDSIRDLRDNVMFMPSSGKYKIFIIDEVHMLSSSAFNALLKTLEEPPAHVVFILATTEAHKIPQTILSRCQRFDFRRIPLKQVADYLKKLCLLENIQAEEAALWLIARQGDGSMRDSLSLLDQVISFANGELTEAQVSQILGLSERSLLFKVFTALVQRQATEIVQCLKKLNQSGQNPNLFLEDLSKTMRHCLVLKVDPLATDMIDLPEDEIQQLIHFIKDVSDSDLHLLFDMTVKSLADLYKADDPQVLFEIALLRMSQAPQVKDLQELLKKAVESPLPKFSEGQQVVKPSRPSIEKKTENDTEKNIIKNNSEKNTVVEKKLNDFAIDEWLKFIDFVKTQDAFFATKIQNLIFVGCSQLKISLQATANLYFLAEQLQNSEMRQKLQGLIDSQFGRGYTFEVLKSSSQVSGDSVHSLNAKKLVLAEEQFKEKWQKDPRIQKAMQVFKGDVKLLKKD